MERMQHLIKLTVLGNGFRFFGHFGSFLLLYLQKVQGKHGFYSQSSDVMLSNQVNTK